MNPNYDFWRELLLDKGFKEPYYTRFNQKGYFVFAQGKMCYSNDEMKTECEIAICEDDLNRRAFPEVSISYKIEDSTVCVWAKKDMDNIECVITALLDPVQLPLCIGISWAAPLVEKLFSLEATCLA